LIKIYLYLHK